MMNSRLGPSVLVTDYSKAYTIFIASYGMGWSNT